MGRTRPTCTATDSHTPGMREYSSQSGGDIEFPRRQGPPTYVGGLFHCSGNTRDLHSHLITSFTALLSSHWSISPSRFCMTEMIHFVRCTVCPSLSISRMVGIPSTPCRRHHHLRRARRERVVEPRLRGVHQRARKYPQDSIEDARIPGMCQRVLLILLRLAFLGIRLLRRLYLAEHLAEQVSHRGPTPLVRFLVVLHARNTEAIRIRIRERVDRAGV